VLYSLDEARFVSAEDSHTVITEQFDDATTPGAPGVFNALRELPCRLIVAENHEFVFERVFDIIETHSEDRAVVVSDVTSWRTTDVRLSDVLAADDLA